MSGLRRGCTEVGHWAILVLVFWKWRGWFMGAIASDDVIIAASGLRLHAESNTLLPLELGLSSTGGAHFLPLGGVLTGVFLWLALTLYEHTSLTLPESWGLVSWISMLWCWRMVSRFVAHSMGTTRTLATTVTVATLASVLLQIPGDYNLNAVLSFPIAGWVTTAVAVWIVTIVFQREEKISAPLLLVLSCGAIMVYELLIFPILCATLVVAISSRISLRRTLFLTATVGAALFIPLVHRLGFSLLSPTTEYSGTTFNTRTTFGQGLWSGIMSSVSAAPLGQLASAARFGSIEAPTFSPHVAAAVCACCIFLWLRIDVKSGQSRLRVGSIAIGVSAVSAGVVLGGTAKYSTYFAGELGRTYLNFPLSLVGVVMIAINLLILARTTAGGKFFALGILFVIGSIHQSANSLVADSYSGHWTWAKMALEDASTSSDEAVMCRHYRTIASQPLPPVLSMQLISYLDQFRQAEFKKGMCRSFDASRISAFQIAGEVGEPEHYDAGSWWWLTGDTFDLEITFLDEPPESLRVPVGSSPCAARLVFRVGTAEEQVIEPNSGATLLEVPLSGVVRDQRGLWSATIDGRVSGWACMLEGEERTLVAPIFFPNEVVLDE